MFRIARVVIPGVPYHLNHRGNRREAIFFYAADRRNYLDELGEAAVRFRLKSWGWCLMDNHVHLLAVPADARALARTIGLAHARFNGAALWKARIENDASRRHIPLPASMGPRFGKRG